MCSLNWEKFILPSSYFAHLQNQTTKLSTLWQRRQVDFTERNRMWGSNSKISRALHSELFSELSSRVSSRNEFLRVETRRVVRHFFVTFENFGKRLLLKLAKTKITKKRVFLRFFVKIRVGTSGNEFSPSWDKFGKSSKNSFRP